MFAKLFQFFWLMLPDRCEVPGCCRRGVRGNENRIDGRIVCDYCHTRMTETERAQLERYTQWREGCPR